MAKDAQGNEVMTVEEVLDFNPGGDNVVLPEDKNKPSFLTRSPAETRFLDNHVEEEEQEEEETAEVKAARLELEAKETPEEKTAREAKEKADKEQAIKDKIEADRILALAEKDFEEEEEEEEKDEKGNIIPRTAKKGKEALLDVMSKLHEEGELLLLEGEKKLSDYTIPELVQTIKMNLKDREEQVRESLPKEFFEAQDARVQVVLKYAADGGTKWKELFGLLAKEEQAASYDLEKPEDHEHIVREYYRAIKFGTEDDINEEIGTFKDTLGMMEKKAKFAQPKLEAIRQEETNNKILEQQDNAKKRKAAAEKFGQDVVKVLQPGEINGIKLDKKLQNMIYAGLTEANYPSLNGRQTNMLGHLLEKHQVLEPNLGLIAEVLMLMSDPEGYKEKIRTQGANASAEDTLKKLKLEQGKRTNHSSSAEGDDEAGRTKKRTLPRNNDFFRR